MNIPQIVKIADDLIFSHTGQHLDYLQEAIIKGTLSNQNYTQIAQEINSSESHLKNTGAELWQLLSDALGEHITKKNFKHIFNKSKIYNNFSSSILSDNLTVSNLNFFSETDSTKAPEPTLNQKEENSAKTEQENKYYHPILDLTYAPEILNFYGRSSELSMFK